MNGRRIYVHGPESLVKAAKRAAGVEHAGTFLRICMAPDNLEGGAGRGAAPPGPRNVPDRALWYAKPHKVFDNLYFVGTRIHSSWALTTSDGIVLIDTLFDYAIEPEIQETVWATVSPYYLGAAAGCALRILSLTGGTLEVHT